MHIIILIVCPKPLPVHLPSQIIWYRFQALECLVRLASIRRSFFVDDTTRLKFLAHLMTGTKEILLTGKGKQDLCCLPSLRHSFPYLLYIWENNCWESVLDSKVVQLEIWEAQTFIWRRMKTEESHWGLLRSSRSYYLTGFFGPPLGRDFNTLARNEWPLGTGGTSCEFP